MIETSPISYRLLESGIRIRVRVGAPDSYVVLEIDLKDDDAIDLGDGICRSIANREEELAHQRRQTRRGLDEAAALSQPIQHTPGEIHALGQVCVRCGLRLVPPIPTFTPGVPVWEVDGRVGPHKPEGRTRKCRQSISSKSTP